MCACRPHFVKRIRIRSVYIYYCTALAFALNTQVCNDAASFQELIIYTNSAVIFLRKETVLQVGFVIACSHVSYKEGYVADSYVAYPQFFGDSAACLPCAYALDSPAGVEGYAVKRRNYCDG